MSAVARSASAVATRPGDVDEDRASHEFALMRWEDDGGFCPPDCEEADDEWRPAATDGHPGR